VTREGEKTLTIEKAKELKSKMNAEKQARKAAQISAVDRTPFS